MRVHFNAGLGAAVLLAATSSWAQAAPAAPPVMVAPAGDAAVARRVELSKRLFRAMHIDHLMHDILEKMSPLLESDSELSSLPAEKRSALHEAMIESMDAIMPTYIEKVAEIYADTFTEDELTKAVEFYESPAGQSIMTKTPQMTGRIVEVMQGLMPSLQADLMNRVCKKVDCKGPMKKSSQSTS